ncbi:hypothetical protein MBOVJF4428_00673 [Mycoplasmopsis agalactiae]|uniref:hypothetical protein n=1 Tax=Mycoplasmopsis agalactiae TaxID=2110 RepID=UPI000C715938|nr:hypothetical protein [Mycoplasmopsis agalactiae]MCE6057461.1 hypothetical protein [Mycoplasmopsis agalactiae]MCE6079237.1 hypothetical protein [Mycoplasmopsis agalactiae]MCE6095630.1 hypothetical protein [Mycoplasmopsis agalactiae]MCE6114876.1 hypothetical protein [Mycoplasmopsis agalactiae]NLS34606.1 hypothetical protein [Mycoplasmopsis agalactiae]
MDIKTSETVSLTFLTVFMLITFLAKIFYFFTLKEKEWYRSQSLMSLWYRHISVLVIVVIISTCALYPWLMTITMRLFYRNYYKSADLVTSRVSIISSLVIAQFIHLNNIILLFKFVVFKKYAKPKVNNVIL